MYDFWLVFNCNHMSIFHRLGVMATHFLSYLLLLRQNFGLPHPSFHAYPGAIFFKIKWFPSWDREKASTKIKTIGLMFVEIFCRHTNTQMPNKKSHQAELGGCGGVGVGGWIYLFLKFSCCLRDNKYSRKTWNLFMSLKKIVLQEQRAGSRQLIALGIFQQEVQGPWRSVWSIASWYQWCINLAVQTSLNI